MPRACGRLLLILLMSSIVADSASTEEPMVRPVPSMTDVMQTLGPGPVPAQMARVHSSEDSPKVTTANAAIDQCVISDMNRIGSPGAAVSVMMDGELLYESGYGLKRRHGSAAVRADTVFRIGSITKQMTAAGVMQLVDDGSVELSDPITLYAPEFRVAGRWPAESITVWNTLTHTSGFPDLIQHGDGTGEDALAEWAGAQGSVRLHAPPGTFWNYSNPNFMLAGLVIERASGLPYRQYTEDRVWGLAGMSETTFDPDRVIAGGNYSWGHHPTGPGTEIIYRPDSYDPMAPGPAGFAFSTAGDLVRWADLLMTGGGTVVSAASAARMQQRQMPTDYTPDLAYGFGIMSERYEELDVRQHGGNVAGWGSYLLWVPERRFAVAVLANTTTSLTSAAYCIVDAVLEPTELPDPDYSTDLSTWTAYEGWYTMTESDGSSYEAEVHLDGDSLFVSAEEPSAPGGIFTTELVQQFLDTFAFDGDGDGIPNVDVTFIGGGSPARYSWARNRYAVGERRLAVRHARRRHSP